MANILGFINGSIVKLEGTNPTLLHSWTIRITILLSPGS